MVGSAEPDPTNIDPDYDGPPRQGWVAATYAGDSVADIKANVTIGTRYLTALYMAFVGEYQVRPPAQLFSFCRPVVHISDMDCAARLERSGRPTPRSSSR